MHTHYDNLKVSRDAPTEVIRAAYKSLSQKYHPDRHADSEEANRIMRLLNAAYEVLRDPDRRAEHDQWIMAEERREAERAQRQAQAHRAAAAQRQAAQRQQAARQASARPAPARAPEPEPTDAPPYRSRKARPERQERQGRTRRKAREHAADGPAAPLPKYGSIALYAAIGAIIVIMLGDWTGTGEATAGSNNARPAPASAAQALVRSVSPGVQLVSRERAYSRPSMTPRGMPWPEHSGYLPGYPVLNKNGLSTLTVDNSGSASDVLLKLVAVDGNAPLPVRTSFVRSGSSFTMENISPGAYDLRYQSLDSGEIFRSERFDLSEIREPAGTSANRNVFKLYAVPDGTSRSVTISEREFP
ncbi:MULTISPECIES: J domain-containing protein [unclassified Cupriavidus]|uniref:J domain-containing protein n=1 Tax=unclassified Cupriavidus TaxID=2640874 RepID=UPI001C001076|nr:MULTISPECIES: J domain-containing protein [unclassified Cupriavidus]MCA3182530.1 J domain-containing protein [Cupriavidus sp.]MCA3189297.1 J domain-containing protein [Cupriavidus sp.]MCA3195377.1 J domain-containing protein [Cupriavidus sp.]MCA3200932.1 J domain-containing protein [Cupriavidus sp.]MCA3210250.1 J domain-containing protein [Cupriavidus sp.]